MERKLKAKKPSKAVLRAMDMPRLSHWVSKSAGIPWSGEQSDVLKWMLNQPAIANSVMCYMKDNGAIVYDPETSTWVGVNHLPVPPAV